MLQRQTDHEHLRNLEGVIETDRERIRRRALLFVGFDAGDVPAVVLDMAQHRALVVVGGRWQDQIDGGHAMRYRTATGASTAVLTAALGVTADDAFSGVPDHARYPPC